ncbi:MAG: hypothetical protein NVS1B14_11150 [Vulcanimicrobiaceae bacterium]
MTIISPAPLKSTLGNAITAERYARIFRSLGWRVRIARAYDGEPVRCLVGLHAKKSAASVLAFKRRYPERSAIVVLTGTDLYRDIKTSRLAQRAMDAADRLVTLQSSGISELPVRLRTKAGAIIQSAVCVKRRPDARRHAFTICVLGHLRREKDPMRAAYAVRDWDGPKEVRVVQAGRFLAARYEQLAHREE